METQESQTPHIIDIKLDVPAGVTSVSGSKICAGGACGLSNSGSGSNDARERSASMLKLQVAVAFCMVFMGVEVVGGIKANSLAILTDAAHLLSDVAAFAISLFSLWASGWEATPRQSYGFFRIEILGALVSIQLIWLLTGILVYEAIARLIHDAGNVQGRLMFIISAFGFFGNLIMALLLGHDHGHGGHGHGHGHGQGHANHDHSDRHHDHSHDHGHEAEHSNIHGISITRYHHHTVDSGKKELSEPLVQQSKEVLCQSPHAENTKQKPRNINVHSAYLHVLGDSIQSLGVMIGGAIIWWNPEWKIIDLLCTLLFSVIVLATTINMIRNILEVLMECTPREIDATKLEKGLCELDGVVAVHELHIWAITVGKVLLACHVTVTPEADADIVLDMVIGYIKREYNISHVTIQIERQNSAAFAIGL